MRPLLHLYGGTRQTAPQTNLSMDQHIEVYQVGRLSSLSHTGDPPVLELGIIGDPLIGGHINVR